MYLILPDRWMISVVRSATDIMTDFRTKADGPAQSGVAAFLSRADTASMV